MIKTAGAAIAGALASTALLPGAALAAAKPDPNRKGKIGRERARCGGLFMLVTSCAVSLSRFGERTYMSR